MEQRQLGKNKRGALAQCFVLKSTNNIQGGVIGLFVGTQNFPRGKSEKGKSTT